jgi:hypothetical protein
METQSGHHTLCATKLVCVKSPGMPVIITKMKDSNDDQIEELQDIKLEPLLH